MARAVGVSLSIDDFQAVSNASPTWQTSNRAANTSWKIPTVGGTPAVMKYLLEKGLLHGDCLTVTGKTIAENLRDLPGLTPGQQIIRPLESPIKESGHIRILRGNLAPGGAVAKITGKEGFMFTGPAECLMRKKACCTPWNAMKFIKAISW